MVVPKAKNCSYAGILIKGTGESTLLDEQITVEPDSFDFTNHSDDVALIAAANQGEWGNDLRIRILNYKSVSKVKEVTGNSLLTFEDNQPWGDGFPVTIYSTTGFNSLDPHAVYFIAKDNEKYTLHTTQKDAFDKKNAVSSEELKAGVIVSPYIQYTKIPGTSCIQVFKASNLNDPIAEYVVSLDPKAKDLDGANLYVESVINGTQHIQVSHNTGNGASILPESVKFLSLSQGKNGDAIETGDMIKAIRLFDNVNEVNITLIGDGGYTVPAYQQRLRELCQKRGDCVPVLSAPLKAQRNPSTAAQDIVNYRRFEMNIDSSWATLYAPHIKIYDEDNNREVFAPPDGFVLESILMTAANYELWYPVAGERRGVVQAIDTKVHFTDSDQDLLYDNGINPIIFEAGRGIKIWGQKTLQSQPSMLDRLNVRLLMVTIGPNITKMLRNFLFEFNDAPTRAEAKTKVEDYMQSIQARRGVTFFKVICDETNNTKSDIDNHVMRLWLIICPNASVERIVFPIAITNNSIKLEQVYAQL